MNVIVLCAAKAMKKFRGVGQIRYEFLQLKAPSSVITPESNLCDISTFQILKGDNY